VSGWAYPPCRTLEMSREDMLARYKKINSKESLVGQKKVKRQLKTL